jgi:class 3 adenylate cyclase
MTAAALVCGSCGTGLPPNAKFCNECGAAVATASTPAEYKQVTVLFADVVHSMDIAAAVGAERLREIMADLVEGSAAVVQRYGGTVDKFTGDGIMAVFGAPVALEDHAVRACLAALGIQEETSRLAAEVKDRDGVDLWVRVGLNSGQVIAGEIGSGALGYTTIGEQVGMAQRMESVARPGGVMLSASTARLVEHQAVLSEPEMVHIKGSDQPVAGQRLLGVPERDRRVAGAASTLVGRGWEMSAVEGLLKRAIDGHGGVVTVVGSPGIGKSRLVREVTALAAARGVEVFTGYCQSHTSDIPFYAVARLLRAATGVRGLDDAAARGRVRAQVPDADPEDLLVFEDLLGIAGPEVALPKIDPDARRRRLTALVNTASLARKAPVIYVIEDAHWIDEVSESMLADFLTVIPQTASLALITYRPEYAGKLSRVPGAQRVALARLTDPETATLVTELLGSDPSVGELGQKIAERAAGNPFFAEEMARELAERGVLRGNCGTYMSMADVAEVSMPATVQATIAARIDRLNPKAKQTLSAAAVIGAKFSRDLLEALGIDPVLEDLVGGELIDQIRFTRQPEYVFHHPLIRTVAYDAQLKSDRAELHRRLAAAIQARAPTTVEENAALIAEHLQAAGDLHLAHGWHMRAGGWAFTRDIAAAYLSWQRAAEVADALPAADPARTVMRIAPRALLCANGYRVHASVAGRFEELRELCDEVGDKASLATGMMGLVAEHLLHARVREASRVASEQMALVESIGNPLLTIMLPLAAIEAKLYTSEPGAMGDVLRWSQNAIDVADGNPAFGWALAVALTERGTARWSVGNQGWRHDLDQAVALASKTDYPLAQALAVAIKYVCAVSAGVLLADEAALREIDEAVQFAERSSDDYALALSRLTLGVALLQQDSPAQRQRGLEALAQVRDMCLRGRMWLTELPAVEVWTAREKARTGDPDGALPLMRKAVQDLLDMGNLGYGIPCTGVLVETLLGRAEEGDVQEAQAAVDRLAAVPADEGLVVRDIWLLRLRALLARARGDAEAYALLRDRYRDMAKTLGFEGHIEWAEAML